MGFKIKLSQIGYGAMKQYLDDDTARIAAAEKNREKLRKIGLSHYYRRKKELEEIRKKYIDF